MEAFINGLSVDDMNKHSGSNFDNFLREEGILEEVSERARMRLLTLQIKDITTEVLDEKRTEMLNRVASEVKHLNPYLDLTSITVESWNRLNPAME